MKKLLSIASIVLVLFGATALTFTGCTSAGQPDIVRIASVCKQAATIGTQEILKQHPDWRPQFVLASSELHQLAISPNITVGDILAIAQRLPVKELQSDQARLGFEGATLLISAIDVPQISADRLSQLQPIAAAIADGIDAGL